MLIYARVQDIFKAGRNSKSRHRTYRCHILKHVRETAPTDTARTYTACTDSTYAHDTYGDNTYIHGTYGHTRYGQEV